MKTLLRNRKTIWYALPSATQKLYDSYGNYTGETVETYHDPVKYEKLSAQSVKGTIAAEAFGLADQYLPTYVTADMSCPITMDTRLWIDSAPYDSSNNLLPHTHVVKAILPTINAIKIVTESVSVS